MPCSLSGDFLISGKAKYNVIAFCQEKMKKQTLSS